MMVSVERRRAHPYLPIVVLRYVSARLASALRMLVVKEEDVFGYTPDGWSSENGLVILEVSIKRLSEED